jgi:hypothetical protein
MGQQGQQTYASIMGDVSKAAALRQAQLILRRHARFVACLSIMGDE